MTHQRARSKFAAHLACRIAPTNNQTRFDATLSRLRVRLGLCCLTIALTTLTFEKLAFADPDPVPDAGTTPDAEPTPGDPMSTSGTTGNTADEVWKPGTIAPSFRAQRRVGEITIDGDPREASWQGSRTTIPFYDFRSTPKWKRSREPTEVSVQYDDKNLYIAIWQNLDKPGEVNTSLYAGDWFERTDYVCLQVDAQGSGQTSRGFCVTPANQRITLMLLDSGASGVGRTEYFDYRIRRSATGLSGEWALPWSSLGVRGTKPKLTPRIAIGVNLSRAGKRFYSAPHQTGSDFHIPDFNPVTGIETISTPRGILINATLIGGYHSPEPGLPRWVDWTGPNNDVETRASLSARIPISTSASVGVTIAPEFSSATIDPVFANPSPFPFFQEERREFFLQKPELFAFGSPFSEQLFYSRTIGLVSPTFGNREIPLLGGIQGFVEHDKLQIGVLATQGTEVTVDGTDIPGTTDAVVRALAYPKPNLRVGGMYTLRYPTSGAPAHAAGVDLRLGQGDGRIQSNAWFAGSDADDKQGFTSHLDSNLSTDEFSMGAAYSYTSSKFSPPLGFYRYPGSQRLAGNAAYSPRVQTPGVEKIRLSVDGESLSDNMESSSDQHWGSAVLSGS